MSIDQTTLTAFGQTLVQQLSQQLEKRFEQERKQTAEESAKLRQRIELLEERIQGLVLYLGQQAHKNGWADIDTDDAASIKSAQRSIPLNHSPTGIMGERKLASFAGMIGLAIRGIAADMGKSGK